ncbi:MAG: hypothetical protein ACRDPY_39525 [Streptosporangiaceae bacterium]
MHRTGLSPYGQDDEAVRWVAVRHGDDHIHVVAMLARQDGGKPSLSWERYMVRAACLAAEQRYGLRCTAPADRTAARRPTRAENEKAARRGLDEAPRITLRRQVTTAAASASSEQEFFARLDAAGLLVRKRFSVTNPGQVTGYSAALPGDTTKDGGPVWYGGGKLAADLSWPKLRQRWTPHRAAPGRHPNLTAAERNAVWEHATRAAADAARRSVTWRGPTRLPPPMPPGPPPTPCTWPPPCSAAASCDRPPTPTTAPPAPHTAASPRPPRPGTLRQAARLLSAFACLTSDRSMAPIILITKLAALAEAVAGLRQSQRHAAHAAAEQLHAAAAPGPARAAAPGPVRQHRRPAHRAVLPPASTARPATGRTPAARPRSRPPAASTPAVTTTTTRPQPLTRSVRTRPIPCVLPLIVHVRRQPS